MENDLEALQKEYELLLNAVSEVIGSCCLSDDSPSDFSAQTWADTLRRRFADLRLRAGPHPPMTDENAWSDDPTLELFELNAFREGEQRGARDMRLSAAKLCAFQCSCLAKSCARRILDLPIPEKK